MAVPLPACTAVSIYWPVEPSFGKIKDKRTSRFTHPAATCQIILKQKVEIKQLARIDLTSCAHIGAFVVLKNLVDRQGDMEDKEASSVLAHEDATHQ